MTGCPALLVIVGPTAAGKSTIAEHLALQLNAELVSADALQVYRGLDIGTAKPAAADRERFRYHGLDLFPPDERCSAGRFARHAWTAIDAIRARDRLPILVGGSGFYVSAVVEGLDPLPASEPRWRAVLELLLDRYGAASLHRWLERMDPAAARKIGAADGQRILRALEVVMRTGRPIGAAARATARAGRRRADRVAWMGVDWERGELARRIGLRLERMIAAGWIDEVKALLASGLDPRDHALQAIGYREITAVLAGELELPQALDRIARSTRHLAKRQRTWFRRWPWIRWLRLQRGADPAGSLVLDEAEALAKSLIASVETAGVLPRRGAGDTMGPS